MLVITQILLLIFGNCFVYTSEFKKQTSQKNLKKKLISLATKPFGQEFSLGVRTAVIVCLGWIPGPGSWLQLPAKADSGMRQYSCNLHGRDMT